MSSTLKLALNVTAFYVGWWVTITGASIGAYWAGPVIVTLIAYIHLQLCNDWRRELAVILITGLAGLLIDSVVVALGIFTAKGWPDIAWIAPVWLVFMWINLGTTLNSSLEWLQGKPITSALLGGVSGSITYYAGARLGALEISNTIVFFIVLTLVWAGVTPGLLHVARLVNRSSVRRAAERG